MCRSTGLDLNSSDRDPKKRKECTKKKYIFFTLKMQQLWAFDSKTCVHEKKKKGEKIKESRKSRAKTGKEEKGL